MKVYVVVVEATCEKRVVRDLLKAGVATYTPTTRRWRNAAGRRVRNERAVFPRYVFVASADIEADFEAVRHCRYVTGVLGRDGQPKPIDGAWLAAFLIVQTFGGFDYTRDRKPKMTVGQAVRIIGGAFQGYLATVREVRKRDVVIGMKGKRMSGKMTISPDQLALATQADLKAA